MGLRALDEIGNADRPNLEFVSRAIKEVNDKSGWDQDIPKIQKKARKVRSMEEIVGFKLLRGNRKDGSWKASSIWAESVVWPKPEFFSFSLDYKAVGTIALLCSLLEMARELMEAARDGDISELYRLIRQDPHVLEGFDDIPFVDTPLHKAASAGNTPVAIEIARLKPSFGRKLNQDGLSPIHLALGCKNDPALECEDDPALESKHDQTVRKLINLDRELICVQGKEGFTPLHCVTERQNLDLLATFLFNCPTSIEKLTNRGETAVHIAVKNQNFGAFEIFLAWLHAWADMKEILELKDDEGNTVLHIAAKTNQHQA
ncbi:hypothetical protein F0562_007901 [Nyssa sinensis]|uniref:Uncharacterized protein n=1 Tax=Nyssa sinensis TaxID=561372 RepID=A0A5J5A6V6_9ASTE|nr:hypothetical protein F0562_007901 [Nyssa sinensis]